MAPSGLLLQHAHMPMPTLTPSRTRNSHSHLYIHAPRVPRRTVSDGIYSLAVSRGQSVEAVPFPRSLVHWSTARPAVPYDLRCQVKSRPGLSGCRSLSACHSRQSSLLHTCCAHFAAANRPILFVCRVLSLSRLLPPVDPFPCPTSIELADGQKTESQTRLLTPVRGCLDTLPRPSHARLPPPFPSL